MPGNPEQALSKTEAALKSRHQQLAKAQRRYKANRKRAFVANNKKEKARAVVQKQATHPKVRDQYTAKANHFAKVAYANHVRAQEELGKVKRLQQKIHGLQLQKQEIKSRLHKVTIKGDKAYGGTDWDRWMAVTLKSVYNCEHNIRPNWYSMSGSWNVSHVITGYPPGTRDDCSSTVTGWALAAGLPDPNGEDFRAGYTGTLLRGVNGWKQVSLDKFLNTDAPGYIVYGGGDGHHTEAKCPSDTDKYRTAGHGSAPVDFGTVHLFGSGETERYFLYLP
jgi:hypothetical protein